MNRFLGFTGKDAMSITYTDIRKFIFHMKDAGHKKASTINVYTAAIRFFFEYTLGYVWDSKKIPKMKRDRKLPVILTREQVNLFIDSMDNYKHKAITATMYSSGLRVNEVCHLHYGDILRKQKMIHVPLSKNRQDRYAILSDRNLEILTEYWYRYDRPRGWLFPSTVRDEPLTSSAVELFIKKQVRKLGLPEGVTPHTMRHCFACHALEDGVSHTFIQQLLGHRSPASTDVYLQMTSKALMGVRSPFDRFEDKKDEGSGDGR
ncbi:MAG: tyrosine-type recombinase/integrase [Lachnospiraceae bacterium]